MFLHCQGRCYSPGPILVTLEKRTPCIWQGRRGRVPLWAKWDVGQEAALLGLSVPHLPMCQTPAAHSQLGQTSRESFQVTLQGTTHRAGGKQPPTGAHLERHGRRSSKSLSMVRQPLLYQDKGMASALLWGSEFCFSFHSSTGACCSHLCRCISLSDVRKGTRLIFTEFGEQVVSTAAVLSGYMCREILLPLAEICSLLFLSH